MPVWTVPTFTHSITLNGLRAQNNYCQAAGLFSEITPPFWLACWLFSHFTIPVLVSTNLFCFSLSFRSFQCLCVSLTCISLLFSSFPLTFLPCHCPLLLDFSFVTSAPLLSAFSFILLHPPVIVFPLLHTVIHVLSFSPSSDSTPNLFISAFLNALAWICPLISTFCLAKSFSCQLGFLITKYSSFQLILMSVSGVYKKRGYLWSLRFVLDLYWPFSCEWVCVFETAK